MTRARDAPDRSRGRPGVDGAPDPKHRDRIRGSSIAAGWASAVRSISRFGAWRFRRTSAAGPIFLWLSGWRSCWVVPVVLDNDANAGALGEARYGAGRELGGVVALPLFYMTLSTGIGGGIVLAGRQRVSRRGFLGGRDRAYRFASRWPGVPVRSARLF